MNDIKYKALLIGNSKFEEDPHNLLELKGPPNDIRSLEETLTHPQVGLHEPSNVQSLLNFSNWEIMEKLEEFFKMPNAQINCYFITVDMVGWISITTFTYVRGTLNPMV